MRKDSHVNSLELSLTQKNEEIDMIEEKLQRVQKQQQLAHIQAVTNSQTNANQAEQDNLRKQVSNLQKDVQSKENQIQQLTTELITLKELIDDFEEQKQVLKSKLEQQQIQFVQLERQFEQTTLDFENQIKQEQKSYQDEIDSLKSGNKESKEDQEHQEQMAELKRNYETELEDQLNFIKNLQEQIDSDRQDLADRDEQITRFNQRVKDLEDALRESVSITAERELVFAQQKKKMKKSKMM